MNYFQTLHSLKILNEYSHKLGALDKFISSYFRTNKSIGSKDRLKIYNAVYKAIRFWRLADSYYNKTLEWKDRLDLLENNEIHDLQLKLDVLNPNRYGINQFFMDKLIESFGESEAIHQAEMINSQAPVFIRVNTIKSSCNEIMKLIPCHLKPTLSKRSQNCIRLEKRENLFGMKEFKDGLFEMQDEGAQIICDNIPVRPKDIVVDYCSGSGGKSLAIAPRMEKTGQIFLHDIRQKALLEARKRLKRAGIENAQFLIPEHKQLKILKNKVDLVIADVPCSGSGVIRRNPESRERISQESLGLLVKCQRDILDKCSSLTKRKGLLAYITCSLFHDENMKQTNWFLSNYSFNLFSEPISIKPTKNGNDGFFMSIFQKN